MLLPAKQQLGTAALHKYRELLRKTQAGSPAGAEETSSLFVQAKERVLLRLRERRGDVRVDPRRALARLHHRLSAARLSLRQLKDEHKERWLRQYQYHHTDAALHGSVSNAVKGGVPAAAAAGAGAELAAAAAAAPAARALAASSSAAGGAVDSREMLVAQQAAHLGTNGLFRHLVLAGVGGACKLFLAAGARTSVAGQEYMAAALARPPGRGLVTVCNHVAAIDDPLVTAALVPAAQLLQPSSLRWTLCATDRCFKSALLAPFFRAAKVLPVERGAGLGQAGMQLAQSRLAQGEWVHLFPEGTRSADGRTMRPARRGVGWLVAEAAAAGRPPPLVLPFVHSGMEEVLPRGSALPHLGREVRVLVGEPVEVDDLLATAAAGGWGREALQAAIAERVGQALFRLKAELEGLALEVVAPQPAQLRQPPVVAAAAALSQSEETLLPLIEDEMDSLAHRWHDRWQRLTHLPSLTQRLRAAARRGATTVMSAGGSGSLGWSGGEAGSFEAIAAATEQGVGVLSPWEPHAWSAAAVAPSAAAAAGFGECSNSEMPTPQLQASPATGLLARQRQALGLLRGGGGVSLLEAAALLRRQASPRGAAGNPAAVAAASALFASPAPMDMASAVMGGQLQRQRPEQDLGRGLEALLALAGEYSADRARHMCWLLAPKSCALI